jgi:hypothetical protein
MGKWVPSVVTILAPELPNGIIGRGGGKSIKRAGGSDLQSLKNPGRRSALQITPIDDHSLQILQLF